MTLSVSDTEVVGLWQQTGDTVAFPSTTMQAQIVVKDALSKMFIPEAVVQW